MTTSHANWVNATLVDVLDYCGYVADHAYIIGPREGAESASSCGISTSVRCEIRRTSPSISGSCASISSTSRTCKSRVPDDLAELVIDTESRRMVLCFGDGRQERGDDAREVVSVRASIPCHFSLLVGPHHTNRPANRAGRIVPSLPSNRALLDRVDLNGN